MNITKLYYVFRKPHKGNYSIERVYTSIASEITNNKNNKFLIKNIHLKHTYDVLCFLKCFIKALFQQKYIVHITGACSYMILAFPFKTKVFTVHDFIRYKKIGGLKGYLYDLLYFKLPIHFSSSIVVVSNAVLKDLSTYFPKQFKKSNIINNPLTLNNAGENYKDEIKSFQNKTINVIQIGSKPLKNYARLIAATKHLDIFYTFLHAEKNTINRIIELNNLQNRSIVFGNLSESELINTYLKNDVLFFASEEEGFGLPIIEAQSLGLVVITSNVAPMNEIGKGCILVDPFNLQSIKDGFEKLFDIELVHYLQKESKENIEKYKLKTIADTYYQYYSSLNPT